MKYYVNDATGDYIGGFCGSLEAPPSSVEVPYPPADARQAWDLLNQEWLPLALEIRWAEALIQRNFLLDQIEWRVTRYKTQTDLGHATDDTQAQYTAVLEYMQALRDINETYATPEEVVWPEVPA